MAEYTTNVTQDTINAVQLEIGNNQNELYFRKPFDPAVHDLENTFRLTKFADLKGRGCKVPQEVLSKLLLTLQQSEENGQQEEEHANFMQLLPQPRLGTLSLSLSHYSVFSYLYYDSVQKTSFICFIDGALP
jgi:selenide,water dikinase